jgi:hypothetical protein
MSANAPIDKLVKRWDILIMSTPVARLSPDLAPRRVAGPALRIIAAVLLAGFVAFVAMRALGETFVHDDFPDSLAAKVEQLPLLFPIHMFSGGLALLLLPLTIAMRRYPSWHRPLGRLTAFDISVAGVTAYPVAMVAPVSPWSAAGFTAQATVWLALLALGLWHVAHRRIAQHRACMLLMTATASGAIFFRFYLALWALFGTPRHFVLFYACDSWIAWLVPLGATAYLLQRRALLPR